MKTEEISPFARRARLAAWIAVAAVLVLLAWRQHRFVDRYAVNMMFLDQWGIYGPMFEERGVWAGFNYQHGPHRQGAGAVVTRLLAEASGWNSRWDAFATSWTLIAAAVAGLGLAWRCGVRSAAGFVAVPLLFLNLRQYEQFAGASNLSHGAMPVLLLVLYALTWFVQAQAVRLALLAGLTFLAVFTGFAFFVGPLSLALLAVELALRARQKDVRGAWTCAAALAAVLLSLGLFFHDYRVEPSALGSGGLFGKTADVLRFAGVMLASGQGISGAGTWAVAVGLATLAVLAGLCVVGAMKVVRAGALEKEPRWVAIFVLAAFAILYCATAAAGRLGEGIETARASRYVTLTIPAGLAICLALAGAGRAWIARGVLTVYVAALAWLTVPLRPGDLKQAETFRACRAVWAQTYLETRDMTKANERAGQEIYPGSTVGRQLQYLEEHRLNLFRDAGK